jgi:hypothetical protein
LFISATIASGSEGCADVLPHGARPAATAVPPASAEARSTLRRDRGIDAGSRFAWSLVPIGVSPQSLAQRAARSTRRRWNDVASTIAWSLSGLLVYIQAS